MRTRKYSRIALLSSTLLLLGLSFAPGCGQRAEDPRTVRGALAKAARALEARDSATLFRLIDQRARHAMAGIVQARREAKQRIEADYPANEQAPALIALGDGAQVATPEALFARRCTEPCMRELASRVGVPVSEEPADHEIVVRTARGTTLHMHPGKDTWYGIVWNTPALVAEAAKAAQELEQIRENAAVYQKRRALEASER
jgi:hypothetical protein